MTEEYFKLFFDAQGYPQDRNAADQAAVIDALLNSPKPVTDLWLFSYGWNNDLVHGTSTYDTWVARMREVQQDKVQDPTYNPLFIGLYWPSKAWADYSMKLTANLSATTGAETTTGGGEGEFEMYSELIAQPTATPAPDAQEVQRFVNDFRPVMDPEGIYGPDYERDFHRLYTLMSQSQPPSDQEMTEFVKILKKYDTPDPHLDPLERENVGNAPIDVVVKQLKDEGAAPAPQYEGFVVDKLQQLFSVFTFWKMKARAAVVGENGVYRFLLNVKKALSKHKRQVRIHLLGHSFGAKLVTAAVYPAASAKNIELPFVNTLVLLLGAFSQFSFSSNIPVSTGASGRYAAIIQCRVVANPLVAIYSCYDTANKFLYPLGMSFKAFTPLEQRYEIGGDEETEELYSISKNPFGALGVNGAQGLNEASYRAIDMQARDAPYIWGNLSGVSCLNVDGQPFINKGDPPAGAHNDNAKYEIFYLALALSRR
jgi:hypothetical protein